MRDETLDQPDEAALEDDTPDRGVPGDPPRRRRESIGQTIGGVLFGFEQQVLRTTPPPQELVQHARPDAPVPAADGSLIHIGMPDLVLPDDGGDDGDADGGPAPPGDR
jgi:hypothetical protein